MAMSLSIVPILALLTIVILGLIYWKKKSLKMVGLAAQVWFALLAGFVVLFPLNSDPMVLPTHVLAMVLLLVLLAILNGLVGLKEACKGKK